MVGAGLCPLLWRLFEEGDIEEMLFLLLGGMKPGGGQAGGGGLVPERLELPLADERFSVEDPGGGPSGGRGRGAIRLG